MSSDAFISIRNVDKFFGKFQAIDDVSIDIGHGEFFSLLGSSGCGKTTLLRMLAGFESPSSGEIYIDGQPMSEVPPHMRPVNMVFQSYAIFPHRTCATTSPTVCASRNCPGPSAMNLSTRCST